MLDRYTKWVNDIYKNLLENSWTLNDIDEMDFEHYVHLMTNKSKPTEQSIDLRSVLL